MKSFKECKLVRWMLKATKLSSTQFNEDAIEWTKEEDSKNCIPRMSKNERLRKFNYKVGKKRIVPLYPRNYVNEKRSHKNRKVGLEHRLACVKEMTDERITSCIATKTTTLSSRVSQIENDQTQIPHVEGLLRER